MGRLAGWMASLALVAVVMTGCSVSNTANDMSGVSGGAVSGSVAAEDRETGQSGRNLSYLENSDNRYSIVYGKEGTGGFLAQYRLDGTLVKKKKTEIEEIEWVTDEWLYYITEGKDDKEVLWRIPIKKTEQGDHLQTGREEKLLKAYSVDIEYAADSYLIVNIFEDVDTDGIYKYDCGTGKMTELIMDRDEEGCLWSSEYPLMWEGGLFIEGYETLYLLDPEKEQASSLYTFDESKWEGLDDYALIGNELYFLIQNNLYRCDCSSKKTERVVFGKKFLKAVRNLGLGDIYAIEIEEMYLNQGRLYFPIDVYWIKKDSHSGKKVWYSKEELFSISLDDMEKIRHEDKLMDYLDQKGEYELEYSNSFGCTCYFEGFADGKVLAGYYSKGEGNHDRYRYVLYDIQTGEISDMAEKNLPEEYEDLVW